jgi:hypothetical protein
VALLILLLKEIEMLLNVTTIMKNFDGIGLQEPNENGEMQNVTLRAILVNALMVVEKNDTGVKKAEKYGLAIEIQRNDEVEVTAEQVVTLKEAVGKPYGPVIVGPVFAILDGKVVE